MILKTNSGLKSSKQTTPTQTDTTLATSTGGICHKCQKLNIKKSSMVLNSPTQINLINLTSKSTYHTKISIDYLLNYKGMKLGINPLLIMSQKYQ